MYFGYDHTSIGTHSVRSGAAMALYLANEHPHRIMLLGRWSSDAFLLYIRPEVLSSFSSLSNSMIQNEDFRHSALNIISNNKRHDEDPLRPNDTRSITTRWSSFHGPDKHDHEAPPRFHLFH
jgi:hypothetical protein